MQPRTTAILLAVAVALGALVYLVEIRGGETRKAAEEQAKQLFPEVTSSDVSTLWLTTQDGQRARIERHEGAWRIVEPIDFPADGTALDGLASSLAELASEGVIDDPQAADVYGLGEAAKRIRFRAGESDFDLYLGNKSPVGGNTYASVDAEASVVYTVPTFRVTGFSKSLADLRERRLLDFDPASLARLEVRWPPDGRVVLERDEDQAWRLVEPLEARADEDAVQTLLSDLRFLRASDFLDEPDAEALAALEAPEFEVRASARAEGEGEPASFEFALGAALGEGRVARSSQAEILFEVPSERLQDLPRSLVAYRFKELASFAILDAQQVELAFASEADGAQEALVVTATRGEQGWTSEPERLQPGKLARLVSELSRLEASDIAAEAPDADALAELGLSPPASVLRVLGSDEQGEAPVLAELLLGRSEPGRGIFARVPDREIVYLLEESLAEHIPISLEAFRNRFVSEEEPEPEVEASPEG